jgi:hypothetical protein
VAGGDGGERPPRAVLLDRAQQAEIKLAGKTLGLVWVPKNSPGDPKPRPKELVADRKGKRPRPGRKPDTPGYRLRWIVERTLAWLGNFRRLVVRYERHLSVYQGFFNLACISILLNELLQ